MCLDYIHRGKEKKEFLDTLPDEMVVWKVVKGHDGRYSTDCRDFPLHSGEVAFKQNIIETHYTAYRGGGHFFLHKSDADSWLDPFSWERVIRCKIKKKWINTVGEQDGAIVLVVKKAIFPKYIGKK